MLGLNTTLARLDMSKNIGVQGDEEAKRVSCGRRRGEAKGAAQPADDRRAGAAVERGWLSGRRRVRRAEGAVPPGWGVCAADL